MSAPETLAVEVPSPCVRLCRLGRHGHCVGCGRDLDEIAGWAGASNRQKLAIRARAAARLQDHPDEQEAHERATDP